MTGVRYHRDPAAQQACTELDVAAYTLGRDVALRDQEAPLGVAAHETYHAIFGGQDFEPQREQRAHAAATAALSGERFEPNLNERQPMHHRTLAFYSYEQFDASGKHVASGKPKKEKAWRVSENRDMAVFEEKTGGSKQAYADPDLITKSNKQLESMQSPYHLEKGTKTLEVPTGKGVRLLSELVPSRDAKPGAVPLGGAGVDMNTPPSCRDTAFDIVGDPTRTVVDSPLVTENIITMDDHPAIQMSGLMEAFDTDQGTIGPFWERMLEYREDYFKFKCALNRAPTVLCEGMFGTAELDNTRKALSKLTPREQFQLLDQRAFMAGELARKHYDSLSINAKRAADAKMKINHEANPDVGEMLTITSGGLRYDSDSKTWNIQPHPNQPEGQADWNFHFGAVIMKSGSDYMNLENYQGQKPTDWLFQIYGTKAQDQTFHHLHGSELADHGNRPTTMVLRPVDDT